MLDLIFGVLAELFAIGFLITAFTMKRKWKNEPWRFDVVTFMAISSGVQGTYWLQPTSSSGPSVHGRLTLVVLAAVV